MESVFKNSWEEVINEYKGSRINSERTLQAVLYFHLREYMGKNDLKNAYILCEPVITLKDVGTVIPDMIIVEDGFVKAVIELKFVPHYYPNYEEDLKKLECYANSNDVLGLLLKPETGKFQDSPQKFSHECLLVFGVIGRHDAAAVDENTYTDYRLRYKDRFLPLIYGVANTP